MKLSFISPLCLIGAGDFSQDVFNLVKENFPVVAADGGANHLREISVTPECVIGDMDSIEDLGFFRKNTKVICVADQNSTDLEKCLQRIDAPLFIAIGFLGSRFDHSLEIMHVFEKYSDKNIIFLSEYDVIFLLPRIWKISLPLETRISFYPLREVKCLKSHGLKYPVDGLMMKQGVQIGTSNENSEKHVSVEQEETGLVCIMPINQYKKILKSLSL